MASRATKLLITATVIAVLIGPMFTVANTIVGRERMTNESVWTDSPEWTDLQGYDIANVSAGSILFPESPVVLWESEKMDIGYVKVFRSQYDFDFDRGRISMESDQGTVDKDHLLVSYSWFPTDTGTGTIVALAPVFFALLLLVVFWDDISMLMEGGI